MCNKKRSLLLSLLLFSACQDKAAPPAMPPTPVVTMLVEPKDIPVSMDFVGVSQSSHLVEIFSRVEGYLQKINYTEGSYVKEGDMLFQIDPSQFVAAVEDAQGILERQKAILWSAQQAVGRFKPLYEQKAASKKDLDDATANELAGQAAVTSAQANLVEAQLNLSYTQIKSPINGLTGRSAYREGTLITPSINGLLTYVAVVDPIWVLFSISDQYLLKNHHDIANKQLQYPENNDFDVALILADGTEFPHKGKVNFVSPVIDPSTGTMSVRATFENPEHMVMPGQFVRARVLGAVRPNAILIPQQCVQQGEQGMYVFVVGPDNKAEARFVTVGGWYQNGWFITEGLKPQDRVIVEGVNKVRNGAPIQEIPSKAKS